MFPKTNRAVRWFMLIASGAVMLQAATDCTNTLELLQTGLLGGIAVMVYIVTKNV